MTQQIGEGESENNGGVGARGQTLRKLLKLLQQIQRNDVAQKRQICLMNIDLGAQN